MDEQVTAYNRKTQPLRKELHEKWSNSELENYQGHIDPPNPIAPDYIKEVQAVCSRLQDLTKTYLDIIEETLKNPAVASNKTNTSHLNKEKKRIEALQQNSQVFLKLIASGDQKTSQYMLDQCTEAYQTIGELIRKPFFD